MNFTVNKIEANYPFKSNPTLILRIINWGDQIDTQILKILSIFLVNRNFKTSTTHNVTRNLVAIT